MFEKKRLLRPAAFFSGGGVEDTSLKAEANDTKKFKDSPFEDRPISRPRT